MHTIDAPRTLDWAATWESANGVEPETCEGWLLKPCMGGWVAGWVGAAKLSMVSFLGL